MIRIREAMTDAAETLRRLFRDPACHTVSTDLPVPPQGLVAILKALVQAPAYGFASPTQPVLLLREASSHPEAMGFLPRLQAEDGWNRWAAGAVVCGMPVFAAAGCSRLEMPALPRSVPCRKQELPPMRFSLRSYREWIRTPLARGGSPRFQAPSAFQAMNQILGLPIAIAGQDFQSLSKALGMRYSLQLVRASGENIRNLDVLGVYQIPKKGVRALSHDAKTGRILLELGMEASGASRAPFILAQKKDDRSYVSCFLED
jgi:hypothetical protein